MDLVPKDRHCVGQRRETEVSVQRPVKHIQIAGVPGRNEPDVGEINYPYLFNLIDELGYSGWIGCEYKPLDSTLAGLKWASAYGIGPSSAATTSSATSMPPTPASMFFKNLP